ncbi:MAG: TatD family hydrolase [Clostridiales bacterium]|nr:TatD family hydrolase [Clostridiales bacterium]
MQLFDSHCHINDRAFDSDRDDVIRRMREAGVRKAVVVGDATVPADSVTCLTGKYDFLYSAYGLHPHDADKWTQEVADRIESAMALPKMAALGEIGLDYHYDLSPRDVQRDVFTKQLELAHRLNKPVIMHIREAHGDAYEILSRCMSRGISVKGVMHCFGGSLESALEYVRMGLFISFSGSLTFKNAPILTRAAEGIPLNRLLIETDCPYMAPVPLRGRRNEPAFVSYVCQKLAEIKHLSVDEMAQICYNNTLNVFEIGEN